MRNGRKFHSLPFSISLSQSFSPSVTKDHDITPTYSWRQERRMETKTEKKEKSKLTVFVA